MGTIAVILTMRPTSWVLVLPKIRVGVSPPWKEGPGSHEASFPEGSRAAWRAGVRAPLRPPSARLPRLPVVGGLAGCQPHVCVWRQLFWEKKLSGLNAFDIAEELVKTMDLPKGLQGDRRPGGRSRAHGPRVRAAGLCHRMSDDSD